MEREVNRGSLGYSLLLLLAALIWGSAFVAQSVGMDYIGPFTFSSVRNIIGFLVLIPISIWSRKGAKISKKTVVGGLICGVVLCASSNVQQCGMVYTTVGKSGFITALYIIFVPVFGVFLKRKIKAKTWISVALAIVGLYLLTMTGADLTINIGDGLMLLCAFLFAFHILTVDHFIDGADAVTMSCIQFGVTAFLSTVLMFLFEKPEIGPITNAWLPILYAGVMSSGVAFTLQIITQRHLKPTTAALIMSMESVFSELSGWIVLGEMMNVREIIGCVLMFTAIILVILPGKNKKITK